MTLTFFVRKITGCCHTRSWTTIQGKETKPIGGYGRRLIQKKHYICTNKRCNNYLKNINLIESS